MHTHYSRTFFAPPWWSVGAVVVVVTWALTGPAAIAQYLPSALFPSPRITLFATGFVALALCLVAGAYHMRKSSPRQGRLRLQTWLAAHVALSMAAIPAAFWHSAAAGPDTWGSGIGRWALLLFVLTIASGIIGSLIYLTYPRILATQDVAEGTESDYLLVQDLCGQMSKLHQRIERRAGDSPLLAPVHASITDMGRRIARFQRRALVRRPPLSNADTYLAGNASLSDTQRAQFTEFLAQRNALEHQLYRRLRQQLVFEAWLYLHLPLSTAMLTLALAHALSFVYY